MNTPITDAAEEAIANDDAIRIETEIDAMAQVARRLELDRAALMEALEAMIDLSYAVGINDADTAIEQAESTLEDARANFPTT